MRHSQTPSHWQLMPLVMSDSATLPQLEADPRLAATRDAQWRQSLRSWQLAGVAPAASYRSRSSPAGRRSRRGDTVVPVAAGGVAVGVDLEAPLCMRVVRVAAARRAVEVVILPGVPTGAAVQAHPAQVRGMRRRGRPRDVLSPVGKLPGRRRGPGASGPVVCTVRRGRRRRRGRRTRGLAVAPAGGAARAVHLEAPLAASVAIGVAARSLAGRVAFEIPLGPALAAVVGLAVRGWTIAAGAAAAAGAAGAGAGGVAAGARCRRQ